MADSENCEGFSKPSTKTENCSVSVDSLEINGPSSDHCPDLADDGAITMLDVLEEEKELEDDANAVLGGSDDQNCTYLQGYVKRQALYACSTCSSPDKEPGGICLACSYACHDGHVLYELYTKRNFRCDCGNNRFPSNRCILFPAKDAQNVENIYNHNFSGRYCTCQRPYPDLEDNTPDEMVQCIMCEDWYHGRHLDGTIPDNHDYSEVICPECAKKYPFLWPYGETSIVKKEENKDNADVFPIINGSSSSAASSLDSEEENHILDTKQTSDLSLVVQFHETSSLDSGIELGDDDKKKEPEMTLKEEKPVVQSLEHIQENFKKEPSTEPCFLKLLQKTQRSISHSSTLFLGEGWRQQLCRCSNCLALYQKHRCIFLLDRDDTVHAYEERGKAKTGTTSHYDLGLSALQRLDRVRQIEAIHGYNNMKSELKEFLQKFANSRKVVREEDIKDFFEQMNARKRQKVECRIPHFCR